MREWSAQDVRLRIETYLLARRHWDVEVLGTLVPDDGHLTVLVRSRQRGTHGQVHSLNFDLNLLYEEVEARTLDRMFGEVLSGTLNFQDMHEVGVDSSGIRHWTEINREGGPEAP